MRLFGSREYTTARFAEASRVYASTVRGAVASLMREDAGWSQIGADSTADLVPLGVIKEHSIRARRLATYNPLVSRGIGIRNAYMWSVMPSFTGDRQLVSTKEEYVQRNLLSREVRSRDEAAFCTDGMVVYLVNKRLKTVSPVPVSRVMGVARAADATDEGDIYAFLIAPVPVSDDLSTELVRDPVWYLVDGKPKTTVTSDDGYTTDYDSTVVYKMVNRLVGEQWGKPDLMGAVYWAQAYKEYLEAAHTMAKALARIAFKVTSATSKQQKAVVQQLAGAQGVGGTASMGPGQELSAVSKAGAGIDFGSGAPLAAMVSAALDVPLSVLLTDGSAGGRQGAETALEEPTFKAFELRRQLHVDLINSILTALGYKDINIELPPLNNELIQRWGQVVIMGVENGLLHQDEARRLFIDRLIPVGHRDYEELPERPEATTSSTVGPLSDGTNANRDEQGGETVA